MPGVASIPKHEVRDYFVLVRPFAVAVRYGPLAWKRMFDSIRKPNAPLPDTETYRFITEYLEHLIRLMTFIDRAMRSLPERGANLSRLWSLLAHAYGSAGYTTGILNVSKYTTRRSKDFEGPAAAIASADVLGDLVGSR